MSWRRRQRCRLCSGSRVGEIVQPVQGRPQLDVVLRAVRPGRERCDTRTYYAIDRLRQSLAGLLGSLAFVREYFLPTEVAAGNKVIGAYVMDMLLTFDQEPGSQRIPADIAIVSCVVSQGCYIASSSGTAGGGRVVTQQPRPRRLHVRVVAARHRQLHVPSAET